MGVGVSDGSDLSTDNTQGDRVHGVWYCVDKSTQRRGWIFGAGTRRQLTKLGRVMCDMSDLPSKTGEHD